MVVVNGAADHQTPPAKWVSKPNAPFAIPREVDTTEVTHAAIPVDEMPAPNAYSASCTTRPVVGLGRARTDDIRWVGGRVIRRLEVGSRREGKVKVARSRTEGANRG